MGHFFPQASQLDKLQVNTDKFCPNYPELTYILLYHKHLSVHTAVHFKHISNTIEVIVGSKAF